MGKKISKRTTNRYNFVYSQEKDQWVVGSNYISAVQEFDMEGHMLKESTFNADGEPEELNEYKYDEQGRLAEELIYFEAKEVAETHRFEYDGEQLLKEFVFYQDGSEDTISFTYNSEGKLIEKVLIDSDGEMESREKFEYSGELLLHEEVLGPDEQPISDSRYSYDEKGNLIETILWTQEDGELGRIVHEYDENGKRDCTERYNPSGQIVARTTFTLDEKGNVIEMLDEDTSGSKNTKLENDEKGNITFQEEYNEENELNHRIERVFNEEGETMETTVFVDRHGKAPDQYYTIKFEFEYFE
jgi:hypothetical protein